MLLVLVVLARASLSDTYDWVDGGNQLLGIAGVPECRGHVHRGRDVCDLVQSVVGMEGLCGGVAVVR